MNVQDDVILSAPRLRRYARALVAGHPGPSDFADDLVQATLRRVLDAGLPGRRDDVDIHLYALLTDMHRETVRRGSVGLSAARESGGSYAGALHATERMASPAASRDRLSGALGRLRLEDKEALLLVVLEAFSHAQAARILKISQAILIARLSRARATLGEVSAETVAQRSKVRPAHLRLVK